MASSPLPTLRIFISHSHLDNNFGFKLVDDLRSALGESSSIWYDAHGGLRGGDDFQQKIREEIRTCDVFIVILSPNALASRWVNYEIDLAWKQKLSKTGKLIIPLLYRKCEVREDLDTLQIINCLSSKLYEQAFTELLSVLGVAAPAISVKNRKFNSFILFTYKHVSAIPKERKLQIALLPIIVICMVFSSIWIKQSAIGAQELAESQAAASAAIATHYPFSNQVVLNDTLTTASANDKWSWNANSTTCHFTDLGYQVLSQRMNSFNPCFALKTNFINYTYEVTMTIIKGDCGVLLFRANESQGKYYFFDICQSGYYFLNLYVDTNAKDAKQLKAFSPSGFNVGLNHPVSVGVVARGSAIDLYIDGVLIDHETNSVYSEGQIGVAAGEITNPTEVMFSDAKIWAL